MKTWGWDGGGTKTEALCLDAQGQTAARQVFGPLNLNGGKKEEVLAVVSAAIAFMAAQEGGLNDCGGLVIGTAGVSNPSAAGTLIQAIRKAGYAGPLALTGDQEIALAGAVSGPGAVLIAGTGAICCGRNAAGQRTRVGGYGYLIDDEGSGYAIGRDILTAVVRAQDGRIPPTCLTTLAYAALGIRDVAGLISWLYRPAIVKKEVAALAPLLLDALAAGDAAAAQIADKAADSLAELALTAWKKLGLNAEELALTGGILRHHPRIRGGVISRCTARYPRMRCMDPIGSAAYGAAMLARDPKTYGREG